MLKKQREDEDAEPLTKDEKQEFADLKEDVADVI